MALKTFYVFVTVSHFLCSAFFHRWQNQTGRVGGPISKPKALWLYFAMFSWFVLPLGYLFFTDLNGSLRLLMMVHASVWWSRGVIELFMMYGFKNWSPRYGMTHDLIHAGMLFGGVLIIATHSLAPQASIVALSALIYLGTQSVLLLFETWFAFAFLKVRGDADVMIWFASDEPKWDQINFWTRIGVSIGYLHAFVQLILLQKAA